MKFSQLKHLYEAYKATIVYINKDGEETKVKVEDNDNIRRAAAAKVDELKKKGRITDTFRVDYDMDSK